MTNTEWMTLPLAEIGDIRNKMGVKEKILNSNVSSIVSLLLFIVF